MAVERYVLDHHDYILTQNDTKCQIFAGNTRADNANTGGNADRVGLGRARIDPKIKTKILVGLVSKIKIESLPVIQSY